MANLTGSERLNAFPPRSRTRQEYSFSPLLTNMIQEVLASAIRQGGKKKIGKEEITLSLFTNNINVYVENFKQSTEKLLE